VALIEIRGLTKLYRMGDSIVRALDGVDLDIAQGEFVAITGASGSGKSTMMHLLGCLDRPTAGSYRLDGRDVSDLSDTELAAVRNRKIGFVFQTFNLINRTTALENVGIPLFYSRKANLAGPSRRALEWVGLAGRAHHNPNELSGGERQRVAIARAVVNEPVLLLADEPTGNLDTRTGEQIMEIFHELNRAGVTVVIVTHEPDIARQARRVVQMRDGKIVSDEPAEGLAASGNGQPPAAAQMGQPANQPSHASTPAAPVAAAAVRVSAPAGDGALAAAPTDADFDAAAPGTGRSEAAPAVRARWMRGARASLVFGVLAVLAWATVAGVSVWLRANYDLKAIQAASPAQPPPQPVIVAGLVLTLSMLLAVAFGFTGLMLGRGARRRIRLDPGTWRGAGRALTGLWLGAAALLVPVLWVAFAVLKNRI
jgi:putative ABC transport system ATP-binding protein